MEVPVAIPVANPASTVIHIDGRRLAIETPVHGRIDRPGRNEDPTRTARRSHLRFAPPLNTAFVIFVPT